MSIIITSPTATLQTINRLLLHLRDYEHSHNPDGSGTDTFNIISTSSSIIPKSRPQGLPVSIEVPPLLTLPLNEFISWQIPSIEKLMISNDPEGKGNTSLFLILDDQGVRDGTVIMAHRVYEYDEEIGRGGYIDEFNKVRVPWRETWGFHANLEIANMGFEEWCVESEPLEGEMEDYWWTFKGIKMGEWWVREEEGRQRVREELIGEWVGRGLA